MSRTITIGRSSQCDIVVAHDGISRVHAEISLVANQYVYRDISKNGSSISGRMINNERISVAAGTEILLANRIPLPWAQIYSLLPAQPVRPYEKRTVVYCDTQEEPNQAYRKTDEMGAGWGILAFLFPIVGWILISHGKMNVLMLLHKLPNGLGFGVGFALNLIAMAA